MTCKRRVKYVLPLHAKLVILYRLKDTVGRKGDNELASNTVCAFPQFSRGSNNEIIVPAMHLWSEQKSFEEKKGDLLKRGVTSTVTRVTSKGVKTVKVKAHTGRRRKRAKWLEALHAYLRSEFDSLRKLSVKFNHHILQMLTMSVIQSFDNDSSSAHTIDRGQEKC